MFTKSKHAGQKVVNLEKIPFSSKPNSFTIRVGINCKNWDHFTCLIFGKYLGAFFPKNNHCRADYSAVINNLTNTKYRLLHWRRRKRDFLFVFWIQLTNRHYRLDTSHGTNSEYIWGGWWWLDTIPILRTKHQNTGCLYPIFQTYFSVLFYSFSYETPCIFRLSLEFLEFRS